MNTEQMRIRMGEMAAEIDRLNGELTATTISWENALAELDRLNTERKRARKAAKRVNQQPA